MYKAFDESVNLKISHNMGYVKLFSHVVDVEIETNKGYITCSKSYLLMVAGLNLASGLQSPKFSHTIKSIQYIGMFSILAPYFLCSAFNCLISHLSHVTWSWLLLLSWMMTIRVEIFSYWYLVVVHIWAEYKSSPPDSTLLHF